MIQQEHQQLSLNEFFRGVQYQIKDPITGEWSEVKTISKMCESTREYLWLNIRRNSVRIVKTADGW